MRRTSPYYTLSHLVRVKGLGGFAGWEVIAAFNSSQVAERYARDCKQSNPELRYAVFSRNGRSWTEKEV